MPFKENPAEISFLTVSFKDDSGRSLSFLESGQSARLSITFKVNTKINDVTFTFLVREIQGETNCILLIDSFNEGISLDFCSGLYELQFEMPYVCFKPSTYAMKISSSQRNSGIIDYVESFKFKVKGIGMSQCLFFQPRVWNFTKIN